MTTPVSSPQPQSAEPKQQTDASLASASRISGMSRLMGSVSVNPVMSQEVTSRLSSITHQQSSSEVAPLTQERLNKYWDKLLENEVFAPLLRGKPVEVTSATTFNIIATNSYFETELKEHKMPILEQLREWTGIRELFCGVEVRTESHEEIIYRPTDKFDSMASDNPVMHSLRKLLTEIDY